jgi:hypothetical protein
LAWSGRKVNRPTDAMENDLAGDITGERNYAPAPLPVLSQEHGSGSVKAVVFSGQDPVGNRQALGVGELPTDASLLEKREQSRRAAVAHGCRSQAYTNESEFGGAAGLSSDELFFANTADMVRRVKPVTRTPKGGRAPRRGWSARRTKGRWPRDLTSTAAAPPATRRRTRRTRREAAPRPRPPRARRGRWWTGASSTAS